MGQNNEFLIIKNMPNFGGNITIFIVSFIKIGQKFHYLGP
jgi:hypothetical protein